MIPAQLQQAFQFAEKVAEGRTIARDLETAGVTPSELFSLFYGLLANSAPAEAALLIAGVKTFVATDTTAST